MEEFAYSYHILIGFFAVFQIIFMIWSYRKIRSYLISAVTLLFPFAGLPLALYILRDEIKDNQVGGVVTYLSVIIGIIIFFLVLPRDEIPWMVIYTMEFFAGLSVINVINMAIEMRYGRDE